MMKTILQSALLCFMLLLALTSGAALQWSNVGMAGFSGPGTFQPKMVMAPGSIPYVVYNDEAMGDKITVKKFDGSNWVLVGNAGFSAGMIGNPIMKINAAGEVYVAYSDYSAGGRMTVQKFDGSSWSVVGIAGFSSASVDDKSLAFDNMNNPFIAYKEDEFNTENIDVMRFNGSAWVTVGSTNFSCNNTSAVSLVVDTAGHAYVAYSARGTNSFTHRVTVQKYDGTGWSMLGGGPVSPNGSYAPTLAFNSQGVLHLAFTDGFPNFFANLKKFDGAAWVSVGPANFSTGSAYHMTMAFDLTDVPYLAYEDESFDYEVQIKRLTGNTWSTVGTPRLHDIVGAFPCLAFDAANVPYISVREYYEREMIVKRFTTVPDYATGSISGSPFCPGATVNVPFTIANGSFYNNNEFTVQLSDANGSFVYSTNIGTLSGITAGTISATLPFDADGTGYRIRIMSSSPNAVSDDNGTDLTIRGIHTGVKIYIGGNGSWDDPLNWSPCGIPDANDEVNIAGPVQVDIPEYYHATPKSILLSNGANLTFKEGAYMLIMNGTAQIDTGTQVTLEQGGNLTIAHTGTLVVNGILDNSGYIENSGYITGSGSIVQQGYINNHSTAHIAPGNSPGKLTITGDLDLGEATLDIEVNGSTPETQYDVLEVSGHLTADDASLQITQDTSFTLTNIMTITFLRAGSISGTMTASLPANSTLSYNSPAAGLVSLTGLASPLPVKLVDFKATRALNGNLLTWITAEEKGTDHFELERSADGKQFIVIAHTKARGKAGNYSWTDVAPAHGMSYYRLRMVESNGQAGYSNMITLSSNTGTQDQRVKVSPNPAQNFIVITNNNPALAGSTAIIYDMQGREQYRFTVSTSQTIQVSNWPSGIYMLKMENGELVKITR